MRKNSEIDTMESLVVPSFLAFNGQTYNHLLEGVLPIPSEVHQGLF